MIVAQLKRTSPAAWLPIAVLLLAAAIVIARSEGLDAFLVLSMETAAGFATCF